jgi:pilus assembly protein CpaB
MKTRRVPLIIGLVLALGTGALLLTYLTSLRPSGPAALTRGVLVALHDIPARAAATSDLFSLQQRSVGQIDSDAISDPKDLAGTYTLVPILAGSVATRSKIGVESAATLPAELAPGMRAVSIAIDSVKGVSGLITPGDRVDVIAIPPGTGEGTPRGYAILRGVLVLALGSDVKTSTAPPEGGLLNAAPTPLTTITLALTPSQVDLIDGADLSTTLRLALRNPNERTGAFPVERLEIASTGSQPPSIAPAASASAGGAPVSAAPAAVQPAGSNASGVIVIDGDQVGGGTTTSK